MPRTFVEALNALPMRPFQWVTLFVCMCVLVGAGVALQLLGIIAPLVMEAFAVERGEFGIAMSAAIIGFGVGAWGGGWLGDRIGRRWTIAIAALAYAFATMGSSTTEGVWELAIWRVVTGLGVGGVYPNVLSLASEWLAERWRPVAISTLTVGVPIGGTIAGWLAPGLTASSGWEGTFTSLGLALLAVCVLVLLVLRDSPSYLLERGKADAAQKNAGKVLDGTVELVAEPKPALKPGERHIGVLHSSNKRFNIGVGIAFSSAALVAFGILSWSTTFLTTAGFDFAEASRAVSIAGITSIAGSVLAGILVRRYGSRLIMSLFSATLCLVIIVLGWQVQMLPDQPDATQRLVVVSLVGLAGAVFSACMAAMYVIMALGYPQSCRSAGIGFGIFMSRVGAFLATAFGGALLQWGGTSVVPFFAVLLVASAMVSAAAFVVDRQVPPARTQG
ncbi:MFS transporter [Altererythrobacter sp. KTW20L]|uniref:MFS transporter n=1 Tax=Altererythrobacter sp. KTW20L TaxID=2942210 RepID=UPI0020BE9D3F|nr:MFS transporter [Altererythrobacter sp. KTW20L]MCL6252325.1 MFS transporter [Altererythrobacter sp. KTW20L]